MDSALVLLIPEAESLVFGWRLKYANSAVLGMPAHVTVLYPFVPFEYIDGDCLTTLAAIFSKTPTFDLAFSRSECWQGIVWLVPEPDAPVRDLTKALAQTFPDYPPYGAAYDEPTPHLTVAQGDDAVLENVAAGLAVGLEKPIRSRITACSLFALQSEGWRQQWSFLLGKPR